MYGYDRRNARIAKEASLIAHRNMVVQAEVDRFRSHHAEQARLADLPYDGMEK